MWFHIHLSPPTLIPPAQNGKIHRPGTSPVGGKVTDFRAGVLELSRLVPQGKAGFTSTSGKSCCQPHTAR